MSDAQIAWLADGRRLHLQHGPIDLIVETWGEAQARRAAHEAAARRFRTVLGELVSELPRLRLACPPPGLGFEGPVARRMERAVLPFARSGVFITPMAAVAGAVAEEVLDAMLAAAPLAKAYVNNGGDIALHLADGERFEVAMMCLGRKPVDAGRIGLGAGDGVGGIATSGRHGRSLSMGIADSVTVIAIGAAAADAAATLIANAVDLPGHPAIERRSAASLDDGSDLGDQPVVTGLGPLSAREVEAALARGARAADDMVGLGLIAGAALFLDGLSLLAGSARGRPARLCGRTCQRGESEARHA